ncbi:MAG: chorismate mutase, partial [Rhodanobacter sp.]
MSSPDTPIADLRREIDEIDTALHDLVMRRAEVAARIGAAKNGGGARDNALQDRALQDQAGVAEADARSADGGSFIRPGREAAILRRLV